MSTSLVQHHPRHGTKRPASPGTAGERHPTTPGSRQLPPHTHGPSALQRQGGPNGAEVSRRWPIRLGAAIRTRCASAFAAPDRPLSGHRACATARSGPRTIPGCPPPQGTRPPRTPRQHQPSHLVTRPRGHRGASTASSASNTSRAPASGSGTPLLNTRGPDAQAFPPGLRRHATAGSGTCTNPDCATCSRTARPRTPSPTLIRASLPGPRTAAIGSSGSGTNHVYERPSHSLPRRTPQYWSHACRPGDHHDAPTACSA